MNRKQQEPGSDAGTLGRNARITVLLVLAVCVLLKLPSLWFPHTEIDELVYWTLAGKLAMTGEYTLQGTRLLPHLYAPMYDQPLFHHPPLFSLLLVPFVWLGSNAWAVVVSWLGHLLCVVGVSMIVAQELREHAPEASGWSPLLWIPLMGVAFDPVLTFLSTNLWIDSVAAGLIALSVALFHRGVRGPRRILLAAAGCVLGLATLTKLTAVVILPVVAFVVACGCRTWQARREALLWAGLPWLVLVLAWLGVFYAEYGVLYPSWIRQTEEHMSQNGFIRAVMERGVGYYPLKLLLLQPVVLLCLAVYPSLRWRAEPALLAPLVWFASSLAALTYLGQTGHGFLMRFLAPLFPSIYVMLAVVLLRSAPARQPALMLLSALCIAYASMQGAIYLIDPRPDEILALVEMIRP